MATKEPFAKGDFVEIIGQHESAGQRGFVVRDEATAGSNGCVYEVAMDTLPIAWDITEANLSFDNLMPALLVPADCLRMVRRLGEIITTNTSDYLTEEYPCLGIAGSSHETSRIDTETVLGRLPRPPARDLQGIHSGDRSFTSAEAEAAFRQVYQGNFIVRWFHSFDDANDGSINDDLLRRAKPFLVFEAQVRAPSNPGASTVDDNDNVATIMSIGFTHSVRGSVRTSGLGCYYYRPQSLEMTESQITTLRLRILHHVARAVGCDLGLKTITAFSEELSQSYVTKQWWKEHVDAGVILADVVVQTMQPAVVVRPSLQLLAQALSTVKKYRLAADLFEHTRNTYTTNHDDVFGSYGCQGKALYQNLDFDEAEAVYVDGIRALIATYGNSGVSDEKFQMFAGNLLGAYFQKALLEQTETGARQVTPSGLFHLCLNAVLSISGFMTTSTSNFSPSVLKPRLRNRQAAKKAMIKACKTDTVEAFREMVHSWAVDNIQECNISTSFDGPSPGSEDYKVQIKQDARSETMGYYGVDSVSNCNNPGCTSRNIEASDMKRCIRCKAACYCSRTCQKTHWKAHRPNCTPAV